MATYKTRKILKITTTSGTDVPIDDTPVFEDWNEIEKLQDGAPWKVEWGPMDRDLFGGKKERAYSSQNGGLKSQRRSSITAAHQGWISSCRQRVI